MAYRSTMLLALPESTGAAASDYTFAFGTSAAYVAMADAVASSLAAGGMSLADNAVEVLQMSARSSRRLEILRSRRLESMVLEVRFQVRLGSTAEAATAEAEAEAEAGRAAIIASLADEASAAGRRLAAGLGPALQAAYEANPTTLPALLSRVGRAWAVMLVVLAVEAPSLFTVPVLPASNASLIEGTGEVDAEVDNGRTTATIIGCVVGAAVACGLFAAVASIWRLLRKGSSSKVYNIGEVEKQWNGSTMQGSGRGKDADDPEPNSSATWAWGGQVEASRIPSAGN